MHLQAAHVIVVGMCAQDVRDLLGLDAGSRPAAAFDGSQSLVTAMALIATSAPSGQKI